MKRFAKCVAAAGVGLSLLLGGCASFKPELRPGFYQAPGFGGKVPARIALVTAAAENRSRKEGAPLIITTTYKGGHAYPQAVETMLASLYSDVRVVAPGAGGGADFLVTVGPQYPDSVDLQFADAGGEPVAHFREAALGPRKKLTGGPTVAFVLLYPLWFSIWPITGPMALAIGSDPAIEQGERRRLEMATKTALDRIAGAIVAAPQLMPAAAREQLQATERRGDDLYKAGQWNEALQQYAAASRLVWGRSAEGQRLLLKTFSTVQQMPAPPEVPEEARRHMERGRLLVRDATQTQNFQPVFAEMEQAIQLAPWWPSAYFNLGTVQAEAGRYADAIANLRLYLEAAPNAANAKAVQSRIYELELKQEQEADATAAAQRR